jgi:ketosteroid isomerase-like protein
VTAPEPADLAARLRRLEDLADIQRLHTGYRRALDAGDCAGLAALFTEVGCWHGASGRATGRKAIEDLLRAGTVPGIGAEQHVVANADVHVEGDRASACSTFLVLAGADAAPVVRLVGEYVDDLARTPDGWRFVRRTARVTMPPRPLAGGDRTTEEHGCGT